MKEGRATPPKYFGLQPSLRFVRAGGGGIFPAACRPTSWLFKRSFKRLETTRVAAPYTVARWLANNDDCFSRGLYRRRRRRRLSACAVACPSVTGGRCTNRVYPPLFPILWDGTHAARK